MSTSLHPVIQNFSCGVSLGGERPMLMFCRQITHLHLLRGKWNVWRVTIVLVNLCKTIVFDNVNCIDGVMISMLASSAVDREFKPRSEGQTKYYKSSISCFSDKYASFKMTSKDWLARNQNNMSKWAVCLSADCGISELALCTSNSTLCSSTKRTSSSFSSHYVLAMI